MSYVTHQKVQRIVDYQSKDNGIQGATAEFRFQVQCFSPSLIKVQVSRNASFFDFSYAVVGKPKECEVGIRETDNEVQITTSLLNISLASKDFCLSFFNKSGQLIQADEKGLGTDWIHQECTVYKSLQKGERFLGLGGKVGNLNRRGMGYTHWNTDYFAYPINGDPLYTTIPFYIGVHSNLCYGIFLDSTSKSHFNFGASNNRFSSFTTEAGDMIYYFIYGQTVRKIIGQYAYLTGTMAMPPLWSLGYHQSRYSYYPAADVERLAQTFREKQIPIDCIHLDIHYMQDYKLFTWNKERFPNHKQTIANLQKQNIKTTVIIDPGIKVEEGYRPYEDGVAENMFIKYTDGTNYSGEVWPGWCHFADFTNPKVRQWWYQWFKEHISDGVAGFWNDMNEIATWGQYLPNNLIFDYEGHGATTHLGRNVFGLLMSRATYEATQHWQKKRYFILTRACYAGVQRYSALWTGDNVVNNPHMLLGIRMLQSIGMSGVSFCGCDIGGFSGNTPPDLFVRWLSIGTFTPFFRTHTMVNSSAADPWSFGEEALEIVRNYISLRYRLLPYIYSLFYQAHKIGIPILRSLAIDFTHEPNIYKEDFQNQFLLGDFMLVAPTTSDAKITEVYLPEGKWYDFYNDDTYIGGKSVYITAPLNRLPVLVKEGGLIPMQSQIQSTEETPQDTLFLHIYNGETKTALEYYEDDGISHSYLENLYHKRNIEWDGEKKRLNFGNPKGTYSSQFKTITLLFHNFEKISNVVVNDVFCSVVEEKHYFMKPISNFDPFYDPKEPEWIPLQKLQVDNKSEGFSVQIKDGT